jgi:hypothetical protein
VHARPDRAIPRVQSRSRHCPSAMPLSERATVAVRQGLVAPDHGILLGLDLFSCMDKVETLIIYW